MIGLRKLFRMPLPELCLSERMLLRALMLPNLLLVRIEGGRLSGIREPNGTSPAIFAFNHNNAFESLFVPVLIMFLLGGRRVGFVIDWMYGHLPVIGWLMRKVKPIFVYTKRSTLPVLERRRDSTNSDVVGECLRRLESGTSIGIFPEGKRNPDSSVLLRGRSGVGHIALRSGAPVIPVGIRFTASDRLGRAPVIGRMVVRFGSPLRFDDTSAVYNQCLEEGRRGDAARMAAVASDEVMLAIADLCGKAYPHALQKPEEAVINHHTPEATCPA